jgi:hypothetical protein
VKGQTGYYVPKALAIPAHEKGNQLQLSIGYGAGIETLISYSARKPVFAFCQGTFRFWETHSKDLITATPFTIQRGERIFRVGGGWVGRSENSYFNVTEFLAGVGFFQTNSSRYNDKTPNNRHHTTSESRSIFTQFNATHIGQDLDFSLAARISLISYPKFRFFNDQEDFNVNELRVATFDPVVAIGAKEGDFKANVQFGFSIPLKTWHGQKLSNTGIYEGQTSTFFYTLIGRVTIIYNLNLGK